jgi:hypothetical protein
VSPGAKNKVKNFVKTVIPSVIRNKNSMMNASFSFFDVCIISPLLHNGPDSADEHVSACVPPPGYVLASGSLRYWLVV